MNENFKSSNCNQLKINPPISEILGYITILKNANEYDKWSKEIKRALELLEIDFAILYPYCPNNISTAQRIIRASLDPYLDFCLKDCKNTFKLWNNINEKLHGLNIKSLNTPIKYNENVLDYIFKKQIFFHQLEKIGYKMNEKSTVISLITMLPDRFEGVGMNMFSNPETNFTFSELLIKMEALDKNRKFYYY